VGLGRLDFGCEVESTLRTNVPGRPLKEAEERQLRQTKLRRKGIGIAEIIKEECMKHGVNAQELKQGSRRQKVSRTRAKIALRCKEALGSSGAELARHLGVTTSSINRAVERTDEVAAE
jgi:hypothetical protein